MISAPLSQRSEQEPAPPSPDYYAVELAARLIVLQILADAIQALEHPR